jgi:transposase
LQDGKAVHSEKPSLTAEQLEIRRLQKELKEAQLERDILKKAVSLFSKSDGKYSGL